MTQVKYLYYPLSIKSFITNKLKHSSLFILNKHLDKFLYILHVLYWSSYQYKDYYKSNGVTIHTPTLKEAIAEPYYKELLDALISWKLITPHFSSYKADEFSKTYKLHADIEDLPISRNAHFTKRANSWLAKLIKRHVYIDNPKTIEEYQLNIISKLTFSDGLAEFIKSNYPNVKLEEKSKRINMPSARPLMGLFTIIDKDFYSNRKPNDISRLYSNIVSLMRELRQFLLLEGKHLQQLDVKNAQIFLGYFLICDYLFSLFDETIAEGDLPEDMLLFKELSVSGKFYEYLAGKVRICIKDEDKRDAFKKMFFKYVWYCELAQYSKDHFLNQAFTKYFPTVALLIEEIKQPNHNEFPIRMQNLEAKIMLDIVGKQLMQMNIPFLTVHDAVLVNCTEHRVIAQQVIEDAFITEFGIKPAIGIKEYGSNIQCNGLLKAE